MRTHFSCFYRYTDAELKEALPNAYFIFDTNALLDILRLSPDLSSRIIDAIEKVKSHVRIPYQVAEEFHNNVIEVSALMLGIVENCAKNFTFDKISEPVRDALTDTQHRFPSDCRELYINKLQRTYKNIIRELENLKKHYRNSFTTQSLQKRICDLVGDRLLPAFSDAEKSAIETEGATRYANKIPPGYKDKGKTNGNQYGDLIMWKELLRFAKKTKCDIILVSNDDKEDWILKPHNKTWGPRPELIKEFHDEVGNQLFHIYSLTRFLYNVASDDFNIAELNIIDDQVRNESQEPGKASVIPDKNIPGPVDSTTESDNSAVKNSAPETYSDSIAQEKSVQPSPTKQ